MSSDLRHASRVNDAVEGYSAHWGEKQEENTDRWLAESWNRCALAYGLDPGNDAVEKVFEQQQVRERVEQMGDVFEIARTEMLSLYKQIANTGRTVLLTDRDGVILEQVMDPTLQGQFKAARICPGADWSEPSVGTNGVGTAIATSSPVLVHQEEHFLSCNTPLSCAGAPILNPRGTAVGVLDVSSIFGRESRESNLHTLALVRMSAQTITNQYFLRVHRRDWVLRFHTRAEFVGLLSEGLVAFDETGFVLAGNVSAAAQLGRASPQELCGERLQTLFEMPFESMDEWKRRSAFTTVWPIRDARFGKRYFAMVTAPQRASRRAHPHASAKYLIKGLGDRDAPKKYKSLRELRESGDPRLAYNARCAERIVNERIPILLQGETGTGKEVMAKAIHMASCRAENPFVPVNCAAIPESLIESELFGYKHGAFTGARREGMRGKIAQSSGGTLFLDEIGDMPPELQTRLLRVLEEQEVLPLGADTAISVDLHIICATHQDLARLVEEGKFREDLYYRLAGLTLFMPPLRDRRDKEEFIRETLGALTPENTDLQIEQEAFDCLMSYEWPGNIRQLRYGLAVAVALHDDGVIRLADLPAVVTGQLGPSSANLGRERPLGTSTKPPASNVDNSEHALNEADQLLRELERHRWNITLVSEALGVCRNTVYRRMRKHGIGPYA